MIDFIKFGVFIFLAFYVGSILLSSLASITGFIYLLRIYILEVFKNE